MRVGIGQIDSLTGGIERNAEAIIGRIDEARAKDCDLVVFPEFAVPGRLLLDLVWRPGFVEKCESAVDRIRQGSSEIAVVVGSIAPATPGASRLCSCAYVIEDTSVVARIDSVHVPPVSIAEESRYFTPCPGTQTVDVAGRRIGVTLGEALGCDVESVDVLASLGAECVIHTAASPFRVGCSRARRRLACECAKENEVRIVYANGVGGVDGVVFDGGSFAVDQTGVLVFQAPRFEEGLYVLDGDSAAPIAEPTEEALSEIRAAIVCGIHDYVVKNGFSSVIVGLSGGIDSALVTTLAVEALGPDTVTGIYLPCEHSSRESASDAQTIASNLGIEFLEVPAGDVHSALCDALPFDATGIVDENLQARARAALWMAVANERNALVLATGNKSEIAVGYCTLYGDTTGALAPIADLYKSDVYRLAERFADRIPRSVLDKAPSAELRPNQRDADDLPPYDVLDDLLNALIDENASRAQLIERGFREEMVDDIAKRFYASEFKRRQLPPGIVLSTRPLGGGRRMPMTHVYRD